MSDCAKDLKLIKRTFFIFSAGKGLENIGHNNRPILSSDGTIFLMLPTIINFACLMDVTYFPYDRQTCDIKVK